MPGGGSKPGERRGGRKKGTPNKLTRDVKEAIINAFEKAGGERYLLKVARDDPKTFCTLLGKVLPMQVTGADGGPLRFTFQLDNASAQDD